MSHPADLIARVKALMLLGLSAKVAAFFAGVPYETAKAWRSGKRSGCIEPDPEVKDQLFVLVRGGIAGCNIGETYSAPVRPSDSGAAAPDSAQGNSPNGDLST